MALMARYPAKGRFFLKLILLCRKVVAGVVIYYIFNFQIILFFYIIYIHNHCFIRNLLLSALFLLVLTVICCPEVVPGEKEYRIISGLHSQPRSGDFCYPEVKGIAWTKERRVLRPS